MHLYKEVVTAKSQFPFKLEWIRSTYITILIFLNAKHIATLCFSMQFQILCVEKIFSNNVSIMETLNVRSILLCR